jgi:hypothetical protein
VTGEVLGLHGEDLPVARRGATGGEGRVLILAIFTGERHDED